MLKKIFQKFKKEEKDIQKEVVLNQEEIKVENNNLKKEEVKKEEVKKESLSDKKTEIKKEEVKKESLSDKKTGIKKEEVKKESLPDKKTEIKKEEVKKESLPDKKTEIKKEEVKKESLPDKKTEIKKEEVKKESAKEEIVKNKKNEKEVKTSESLENDTGLKAKDLLERRKEKYQEEKKKEEETKNKGFFKNLKEKLTKSRQGLFKEIKNFFTGRTIIDDEMYEELEDLLIQSDIGMEMTLKIVEELRKEVKARKVKEAEKVYDVLKDVLNGFLVKEGNELTIEKGKLNVILIIGVNGVGKTTTIGKMASKLKSEGKKVIIGAADTFRAAAIEQLEEWANRADVELIKHTQGADPGAVVFDTLKAAKNREFDVAIIDTAGRLHNKNNLMKELEKINKIIKSHIGEDKYESILVLDGTTGQNGLSQAKAFNEITELTGFILTKLDGTAKGGIIFSVSEELKKPVKFIGVGEGIEDLREFNSQEFINAIFE